ncbi:nicotinate-nucleotide--dimethylbenzimidazole phosphoribosyltransferase [Planctomicrobium sp. SH668]|uniref:nicotinate-nucleotide--dimethylbenzimidazole phosphoribosyltransferase n=1 Tax=Planctomicrobium sp. SH668 TaxID=3448126 RepID=UPI003F5B397E
MLSEQKIRHYIDSLAKPPGSLGRIESLAAQLSFQQQTLSPRTTPRRIVLFAGDHGVVEAGVTPWPSAVTGMMIQSIVAGVAASSLFAESTSTDLRLIDVGSLSDPLPEQPKYRCFKVRAGTRNLALTPALTTEEFRQALDVGAQQADEAANDGMIVVASGEMGIGNTTPASCLTALLTGAPSEVVVGRGAGADEAMVQTKQQVVRDAVARANHLLQSNPEEAISSVCGLEIAAMAGFYRRACDRGMTIVLDGFIATSAALIAEHLWPGTSKQMIAAHQSAEPGHAVALKHLHLEPVLNNWELRLGEGTGALTVMPLLDIAAVMMSRMATLQQAGVSNREP